jgi:hypothetical protein
MVIFQNNKYFKKISNTRIEKINSYDMCSKKFVCNGGDTKTNLNCIYFINVTETKRKTSINYPHK